MPNKSNNRVASLDLGTNTFHLLIAEEQDGKFIEVYRDRRWVSLAEDGIDHFSEKVLSRAWSAVQEFALALQKYQVNKYKATGTEGFRSADNGKEFLEKLFSELGIKVEIISGEREAELIYLGTELIVPGTDSYQLIMDIGGGSTEFILYNKEGIKWSASYKAGVTYLYNYLQPQDPLSTKDKDKLIHYFDDIFQDFPFDLISNDLYALVGASGSFEVLESMHGLSSDRHGSNAIAISQFEESLMATLPSTLQERLDHPLIPDSRAKLIVVSFILIDYIISRTKPSKIIISPFALKEGVIRELLKI